MKQRSQRTETEAGTQISESKEQFLKALAPNSEIELSGSKVTVVNFEHSEKQPLEIFSTLHGTQNESKI
jgi:hypothetical protein